jgi:murein DD-endopeptidase MepM/ murein hydrolase activator NlpD
VGGSFSHTGPYTYSFDFQMPAGTLVLAARAGVVVRVIEIFTRGGPSPGLRDQANLVTVRHADGTFGEYVHLCPHCVLVREGDRVEAGQPLARSGQTGFTSEPHLHFMVWKATADGQFETVPIRFDDGSVEGFVPRQDLSYGGKSSPHP